MKISVRHAIGAGVLALAGAMTATVPGAGAATGELDLGFGTAGIVVLSETGPTFAFGTTVQPDGKVVVVGRTGPSTDYDALVVRLLPDGSPDPGFDRRRLGPPGGGNASADAVAVQPDGRIVVVGHTTAGHDALVWRLLPDGTLDLSFGDGDGTVVVDALNEEVFTDVAIAPNGRIVVVGFSHGATGGPAVVYAFTPSGGPDSSFDTDGRLSLGDLTTSSMASDLAIQTDGKILVAGDISPVKVLSVRRLTVTGAMDTSFGGGDGVAVAGTLPVFASHLALQPDGRIVVAGTLQIGNGQYDAGAARFTPDGEVDPSFGPAEGARIDLGGAEIVHAVAVTASGSVIAAALYSDGPGLVVGWTPDGRPDPAMGAGGGVLLPRLSAAVELAAQPDGKVVVVGYDEASVPSGIVVRLRGDHVPGSPGSPVPLRCHGKPATVVGTGGKDKLRGTQRDDVIIALGGADVVKGLGGDDLVCAGGGNDRVTGGPGKDHLHGEQGRDRLLGGTGKDRLVGGPGRDEAQQ